jgi:sec-independent protein translocase protein TatC
MADNPDDPSDPDESDAPGAVDGGGRDPEESGREDSPSDESDATDDESTVLSSPDDLPGPSSDASEPSDSDDDSIGGLRRVDDQDRSGDQPAAEATDSVGLPGPSMDTQPSDEPVTTADSDSVADHVADAPYADDPDAARRETATADEDEDESEVDDAPISSPIDAEPEPLPDANEAYTGDPEPIRPDGAEAPMPAEDRQMAADAGSAANQSFMDAPPDDEEMPLTEHIEEMVLRLSAIAVVAAGVASIFFFGSFVIIGGVDTFIQELWYHIHPGTTTPCVETPNTPFAQCAAPHVYGPLEYFLTKVKLSGLVGLVIALPVGIYQTYLFMRPGLYPKERRYYLASVPLSFVLALMGVAFATFVILPLLFEYFLTYSADTVSIAFRLEDTINLMLVMMAWLAVIFQIPLLMMLGVLMGVTSRRWMASRRIYFWGGFGGVAFLFSAFDPTGVAPILLTITMVVLFEVTLLLLRWVGR